MVNQLPKDDAQKFNSIIKSYEKKNFKRAIRSAEELLEKYPNHSETLAMKGFVLKAMNKVEEGYELVKKAVEDSKMTSHVVWRVYGLMFKDDKNFTKAAECFQNCVKINPNDVSILHELSNAQMQIRDYNGLIVTKHALLKQQPNELQNWVGCSLTYYFLKNYEKSRSIIDTLLRVKQLKPYEISQSLLFKAHTYKSEKNYANLLKFLNENKTRILNNELYNEYLGEAFLELKKFEEAKKVYLTLLTINGENHEYIKNYIISSGLPVNQDWSFDKKNYKDYCKVFEELENKFQKSSSIKRIALNYYEGDLFKKRLKSFVERYLKKTIPSLFTTLKGLYKQTEKISLIERIFQDYLTSLTSYRRLNGEENTPKNTIEPPSTLLWVQLYLAYHFNEINNQKTAFKYINDAIDSTPTVLELYICRAKIYEKSGNPQKASEDFDLARRMDLADRYLNTRATKYLLKADNVNGAEKVMELFAKQDESYETNNLFEMQCMWYEVELGYSHLRRKEYSLALKQFASVDFHFNEIIEDQLDFHGFSLRKFTLLSYIDMVEYIDRIYGQEFFYKAALGFVKTSIEIYDNQSVKESIPKLFQDQKSKFKSDKDPFGLNLLKENNLNVAERYMKLLLKFSSDKIDVHYLAIEFYRRKVNYMSLITSLKKASQIDPKNPFIHRGFMIFFNLAEKDQNLGFLKNIVDNERKKYLGNVSLNDFNNEFGKKNTGKLLETVIFEEVKLLISGNTPKDSKSILDSSSDSLSDWKLSFKLLSTLPLSPLLKNETFEKSFQEKFKNTFPESTPLK